MEEEGDYNTNEMVEDKASEEEEDEDTRKCKSLFRDLKFFLSREVFTKLLFMK